VKMYRPEVKTMFLDAEIKWAPTGEHTFARR
jgi:hypothetical protein